MTHYTSITIIYNPNSTGKSGPLARELKAQLKEVLPHEKVSLTATQYAGHGELLSYQIAKKTKRALVISASGDGGYHDVINGLMKAKGEGASPVAGLLPAGNANDHYHAMHDGESELAYDIAHGRQRQIDLLQLTATSGGKQIVRYAHSYIGLGITSKAGRELNKTKLNPINELWIILKQMLLLKPVRLVIKGKVRRYDSLVFSNIGKMSKVISLSKKSEVDDGKFEVAALRRRSKFRLFHFALKASTIGLDVKEQRREYTFKTTAPTLIQCDGEITRLDRGTTATVSLAPATLECIV